MPNSSCELLTSRIVGLPVLRGSRHTDLDNMQHTIISKRQKVKFGNVAEDQFSFRQLNWGTSQNSQGEDYNFVDCS